MKDTTKRWIVRLNPQTALIPGHIVEVDDENRTPICIVHESEHNWKQKTPTRADIAMLIAAAPELLNALKASLAALLHARDDSRSCAIVARKQLDHCRDKENIAHITRAADRWDKIADGYDADFKSALAIIAKAEGKKPKATKSKPLKKAKP